MKKVILCILMFFSIQAKNPYKVVGLNTDEQDKTIVQNNADADTNICESIKQLIASIFLTVLATLFGAHE